MLATSTGKKNKHWQEFEYISNFHLLNHRSKTEAEFVHLSVRNSTSFSFFPYEVFEF